MKIVSVQDVRYRFSKIEELLRQGEELVVTKRGRSIARLLPNVPSEWPDFEGRLRAIYSRKKLVVSGAQLISEDRNEP